VDEIAIISFTNYPKGQNRPCMAAVMEYTKREAKTLWQKHSLVSGINCRPESVYDDFLSTKLLYHKDDKTLFSLSVVRRILSILFFVAAHSSILVFALR